MKTLSRSIIILLVFTLLAALMVVSDAAASAVAVSMGVIDPPRVEHREQPDATQENPPEVHEKPSMLYLAGRWVRSTGKNVIVMSVLVVLIVFPKSVFKRIRKGAAS